MPEERIERPDRVGLRIEEAAASLGLSKRAFEEHILPRCPKLYVGRAVVIPRKLFEQHIERLAKEEAQETRETAEQLLARAATASR